MKKILLIVMALLTLAVSGAADEARDITQACTFVRKTNRVDFRP